MRFCLPVIFEFAPCIFVTIVFKLISLSHLFTPNHRSFLDSIIDFNVSSIKPSHLMSINTLMILMFVLLATNSSTAWTFLVANHHFYHINVMQFIFFFKFIYLLELAQEFCLYLWTDKPFDKLYKVCH